MVPIASCTPSVTVWLWEEEEAASRRELEKINQTAAADSAVSKSAASTRSALFVPFVS